MIIRAINYTNLHGGTYSPRHVLHTFFNFFKNNFFQKNFWALFHTPGGAIVPHFRIPLLQLHIPIFSQRLHPIYLLINLMITSTVTPTPIKLKNE